MRLEGQEGSLRFTTLLRCGVLGAGSCARPRSTEPFRSLRSLAGFGPHLIDHLKRPTLRRSF